MLAVSGTVPIKALLTIADKGTIGGRCVDHFPRINESEVIGIGDLSTLVPFNCTADIVFLGVEFGVAKGPFQNFETLFDSGGTRIFFPTNLSAIHSQQKLGTLHQNLSTKQCC